MCLGGMGSSVMRAPGSGGALARPLRAVACDGSGPQSCAGAASAPGRRALPAPTPGSIAQGSASQLVLPRDVLERVPAAADANVVGVLAGPVRAVAFKRGGAFHGAREVVFARHGGRVVMLGHQSNSPVSRA